MYSHNFRFILICLVFLPFLYTEDRNHYEQSTLQIEFTNLIIIDEGYTNNENLFYVAKKGKNTINLMNITGLNLGDQIKVSGKFLNEPNNYYQSSYFLGYFWVNQVYSIESKPLTWFDSLRSTQKMVKNYLLINLTHPRAIDAIENLFFGEKLNSQEKEIYQQLGVLHLFVVSGLHLQILLSIVSYIFRNQNKYVKKGLQWTVMIVFGFLNNFSIPIMRAILFTIFKSTNRYWDLGLIGLIVLCFFPLYISNLSFILTYSFGFVIILTNDIFKTNTKFVLPFALPLVANLILYRFIDNYTINFNSIIGSFVLTPFITLMIVNCFAYLSLAVFGISNFILAESLGMLNQFVFELSIILNEFLFFDAINVYTFYTLLLFMTIIYFRVYLKKCY